MATAPAAGRSAAEQQLVQRVALLERLRAELSAELLEGRRRHAAAEKELLGQKSDLENGQALVLRHHRETVARYHARIRELSLAAAAWESGGAAGAAAPPQAPLPPPSPCFPPGCRVRVRDSAAERWQLGTVADSGGGRCWVRADGWRRELLWREIEPLPESPPSSLLWPTASTRVKGHPTRRRISPTRLGSAPWTA
eukprot:TRINITY_DN11583_c0_g1_i1.p1 TRINITY_DN11583_c0_g1~~TRINITY_DN11583_c0_g1_i1.p1  ORF type:complete len:218 (+),score=62.80 TRINITY_DN11583_c0_g1_i1:66-656(+)